jgi:hypothetical protein
VKVEDEDENDDEDEPARRFFRTDSERRSQPRCDRVHARGQTAANSERSATFESVSRTPIVPSSSSSSSSSSSKTRVKVEGEDENDDEDEPVRRFFHTDSERRCHLLF